MSEREGNIGATIGIIGAVIGLIKLLVETFGKKDKSEEDKNAK